MFVEFAQFPAFSLTCVGIVGLIIGSFLNVVIVRFPKMLQMQWRLDAQTYLHDNNELLVNPPHVPYNLLFPPSHCTHCDTPIYILDNIPVLGFLMLKGRCRSCQEPISWRYPLVELLTAFVSVITIYKLGFNWLGIAGLIFTWALIALSFIDIDSHLLPDDIILPFLWGGLLINLQHGFTNIQSALIGAMGAYLFLWSVFWTFRIFTHKEGMGYGDFKFFAMLGAWLGFQKLPMIILIASTIGTIVGIGLILVKHRNKQAPIPFGPFLAIAGWLGLLWGDILSFFPNLTHL